VAKNTGLRRLPVPPPQLFVSRPLYHRDAKSIKPSPDVMLKYFTKPPVQIEIGKSSKDLKQHRAAFEVPLPPPVDEFGNEVREPPKEVPKTEVAKKRKAKAAPTAAAPTAPHAAETDAAPTAPGAEEPAAEPAAPQAGPKKRAAPGREPRPKAKAKATPGPAPSAAPEAGPHPKAEAKSAAAKKRGRPKKVNLEQPGLGCSKCRWSTGGCSQCRRWAEQARGHGPGKP